METITKVHTLNGGVIFIKKQLKEVIGMITIDPNSNFVFLVDTDNKSHYLNKKYITKISELY